MINNPPPCNGLNIRIPIIIPIKGRGFINQGSGLPRVMQHVLLPSVLLLEASPTAGIFIEAILRLCTQLSASAFIALMPRKVDTEARFKGNLMQQSYNAGT